MSNDFKANSRNNSKLSNVVEEEKSESRSESKRSTIDITGHPRRLNYREELIIYFCDQMLPYIVAFWELLDPATVTYRESSEINVPIKDRNVSNISTYRKSTKYSDDIMQHFASALKSTRASMYPLYNIRAAESSKFVVVASDSILNNIMFDWFVPVTEEHVHIVFKNGNEYMGMVTNKVMDGKGVFVWNDGAKYEGDFQNGEITGKGLFKYAECSHYQGEFCNGMLHGLGAFYPSSTTMLYNGNWRYGKKHGKGWMLYITGDFYEGEWVNDCKEGVGYREYLNGTIYNGHWKNGLPDGQGMIHFYNDDFYQGEWSKGNLHGQGEYTWKAGMVRGLTLTIENRYKGTWVNGKRDGFGTLYFGMEGSKLISKFRANQKQGQGTIICGDGTIIQKSHLFQNDKPMHKISLHRTHSSPSAHSHVHSVKSVPSIKSSNLSVKRSMSMNKFRLNAKCTPITIPVHGTASSICISAHIHKLRQKYVEVMVEPKLMGQNPSTWRMSLLSGMRMNLDCTLHEVISYEFEERKLRNAILFHYQILQDLYTTYASLTYSSKRIKPVLSRLMLWQMHRDLEVYKIGKSLVQIDEMLNEFPGSAIESKHNPFEPIYFWQFMHLILLICWEHYSSDEFFETYKENGIYAQMLKNFIKDFVWPNFGNFKGESLFKYKDLLPIQAVYLFYKSVGEPHTARVFLRRCCVKKWEEPICYLGCGFKTEPKIFCGINAVCTSANVLYLPEDSSEIGDKTKMNCDCPFERDVFYRDLKIFRSLGPKQIVSCLCEVCPLIRQDFLVTYMDYELTFLEFHEVLLLMSLAFVAQVKKEEERLLKTGDVEDTHGRNSKKESASLNSKKRGAKGKK